MSGMSITCVTSVEGGDLTRQNTMWGWSYPESLLTHLLLAGSGREEDTKSQAPEMELQGSRFGGHAFCWS
jgi:hypothetical protein